MKKSVWRQMGIVLLAVSTLFLGACKQAASPERASNIDIYTMDAIDITAKAYPGFIYVAWGDTIYDEGYYSIYRNDGKRISSNNGDNSYIDSDIKDGVTYKYTIYSYAEPGDIVKGSNTENNFSTYYVVKGNTKSASAKAIKPDYINDKGEFIEALTLANYESGGNKKYIISKKNLRFNVEDDGIRIAFPTKAYLKYTVNLYKGNSYDTYGPTKLPTDDKGNQIGVIVVDQNFYKMDGTYSKKIPNTSSGTYQVEIKIEGFDNAYVPSYIVSDPITIEQLDVNEPTRSIRANYIDNGKTIRNVWEPATNSLDKEWPAEKYKIYLKDAKNVYTDIAATIKADKSSGNTVYYAEYAVADNSINYAFYIVLADNGKVENNYGKDNNNNDIAKVAWVGSYGELDMAAPVNANALFTDFDGTDVANDAFLMIEVPKETVTVDSVQYKIVSANTDTDGYWDIDTWLLLDSEISVAVPKTADYLEYLYEVKDIAIGNKIVFLYTIKEPGKKDRVEVMVPGHNEQRFNEQGDPVTDGNGNTVYDWFADYARVNTPQINGEFDFAYTSTDGDNKGKFTIIAADNLNANLGNYKNYTYEIYYAPILEEFSVNDIDKITTTWTAVPVTIAWNADAAQYKGESAEITFTVDKPVYEDNLDATGNPVIASYDAYYVFKFVKINKNVPAGTEDSVAYAYSVQHMTKAK